MVKVYFQKDGMCKDLMDGVVNKGAPQGGAPLFTLKGPPKGGGAPLSASKPPR